MHVCVLVCHCLPALSVVKLKGIEKGVLPPCGHSALA